MNDRRHLCLDPQAATEWRSWCRSSRSLLWGRQSKVIHSGGEWTRVHFTERERERERERESTHKRHTHTHTQTHARTHNDGRQQPCVVVCLLPPLFPPPPPRPSCCCCWLSRPPPPPPPPLPLPLPSPSPSPSPSFTAIPAPAPAAAAALRLASLGFSLSLSLSLSLHLADVSGGGGGALLSAHETAVSVAALSLSLAFVTGPELEFKIPISFQPHTSIYLLPRIFTSIHSVLSNLNITVDTTRQTAAYLTANRLSALESTPLNNTLSPRFCSSLSLCVSLCLFIYQNQPFLSPLTCSYTRKRFNAYGNVDCGVLHLLEIW